MELLQHTLSSQFLVTALKTKCVTASCSLSWKPLMRRNFQYQMSNMVKSFGLTHARMVNGSRKTQINISKFEELLKHGEGEDDDDDDDDDGEGSSSSRLNDESEDSYVMNEDERKEWRRKIRDVIDKMPDIEEEIDLVEKRKKMQKLLAEYPLVVEEEDPDWPEDADGWGFNLGQFFNKISIKNVKKDNDDDDEKYDSENEIVWKDDDYIRPIKDITTAEWEECIFKDFSPLVVLVHNRYKRPKKMKRFVRS